MSSNRIENLANGGFFAAIIAYVLWRVTPNNIAVYCFYAGLLLSLITAVLAVVMMVKKTDGKAFTLHKVVLCLPLVWFLLVAIPNNT